MKSASRAAAFGVALVLAIPVAQADDAPVVAMKPSPSASLEAPPELAPPPSANIDTSTDPEIVAARSKEIQLEVEHETLINNDVIAAKQQAYDNDWMLRDYTARLQQRGLAPTPAPNKNDEMQPADPNAPLASQLDPLLPPPADTAPKARPPREAQDSPDAANERAPKATFLQPLLPPLSNSNNNTVTRLDAWGSNTVAVTDGMDTLNPTGLPGFLTPGIHDLRSPDNNGQNSNGAVSSLDVPGLTAERQGLGDNNDLNLPDAQMETATENADNRARHDFLVATVASNDSAEFFKRQSEALAPPNALMARPTASGNIPLGPSHPYAPPIAKIPPTTGIRSHVDDPFDLIGGHRNPSQDGSY